MRKIRHCLGKAVEPPFMVLFWQRRDCFGDECTGGFCWEPKELDQKFYYWSGSWEELGRSSKIHELRTLRSPERKRIGSQAAGNLFSFLK